MIRRRWPHAIFAALLATACAAPQSPTVAPRPAAATALDRPIPYPVVPPAGFERAVERGTRTTTGAPGPRYWQQWTNYRIETTLDPAAKRVDGTARLVYHNRSPDTLDVLLLHLHQNLHAPGVVRNEPQEVTGGVELKKVAVRGQALIEGQTYEVDGTRLALRPAQPLLPGDSAAIDVEWGFKVPQSGAGRMGWDDENLFFIAYWYPQMAVYDDVVGWQADPYLGNAEFYMGYGSYDVKVHAPAGWVVRSTGELQNPTEVLPVAVLERLARAERSDSVVHVLSAADLAAGRATLPGTRGGRLTWHFAADSVRDIAFSATRQSLWDAVRTPVGDRDGDGQPEYARIEALYRPAATRWTQEARYAAHAIAFLSRFTAFPYPYSHMTSVEGANVIGGGMEFPMMTLIGAYTRATDQALYEVTAHELAHEWLPMIVGIDEKRYGWMDEGTTTFNEAAATKDFFPQSNPDAQNAQFYLRIAQAGLEGEMMRWTDYQYPGPAGVVATYMKPSTVLVMLRALIGEDAFLRGYHTFVRDWAYKHPKPWDLFNTFDTAAGQDLGWFWRTWYYETWTLDQAVESVVPTSGGGATITVRDLGDAPMPARLTLTRENGETLTREVPVETWLRGARTATVTVPAGSPVVRVEIDAAHAFPDLNRENNVWTR
jgi:hypothetical protein